MLLRSYVKKEPNSNKNRIKKDIMLNIKQKMQSKTRKKCNNENTDLQGCVDRSNNCLCNVQKLIVETFQW